MADIFVTYTRADQELVHRIVALLEGQGWTVWWDTRIEGGERWDAVIEREITAARCVVVWTPQSLEREWVHLEAHHGRERGILAPILVGVDKPPFAFSLIQARNLSGWDGTASFAVAVKFLEDVRHTLKRAAGLEAAQRRRAEGRIKIDVKVIHGAPDGWFKPGAGKTEWFKDIDIGPETVVVPPGEFIIGSSDHEQSKAAAQGHDQGAFRGRPVRCYLCRVGCGRPATHNQGAVRGRPARCYPCRVECGRPAAQAGR